MIFTRQMRIGLATGLAVLGMWTATGQAADYSDPKKTVETLALAIKAEDVAAVRDCMTASDDNKPFVAALAKSIVANTHLLKSAEAKFGDDGKQILQANAHAPKMSAGQEMAQLADADEKIDGDEATLTPKADPDAKEEWKRTPHATYFKKVGDDWKVDVDKVMDSATMGGTGHGPNGGMQPDQKVKMMSGMSEAMATADKDTADDIDAGKYATVAEARTALQQKMRSAMMEEMQKLGMMPGGGHGGPPGGAPANGQ